MRILYSFLFIVCLAFSTASSPPVQHHHNPAPTSENDLKDIFSLEDLQFAFKNLKNIVDVIVERINLKINKVKLSGNINCIGNSCLSIPEGSVATISLLDTSRQDAPSITLASKKITNLSGFPITFEIEYDKSLVANKYGQYSIRAEIRKDNTLSFTTDTQFSFVDEKFEPLTSIDFNVISIQPSLPTAQMTSRPMPGGLNEFKQADSLVKGYVNQLREKISKYLNNHLQLTTNSLVNLEAVSFRSQVVAGKNYFIKVKAENYGHLHVRIFVPLPIYGKEPELAGIHWGPFSVNDPIDYIKADENMADDYVDEDEMN